MSAPLNTLTRVELARETISAPVSDDDYGLHPRRPAYPGVVLADIRSPEYLPPGSVGGLIRELEMQVARLTAENAALRGAR